MASKVVIITGASRGKSPALQWQEGHHHWCLSGKSVDDHAHGKGIGLAVAHFLAKRNHKLVLVSRTEGPLNDLKRQSPNITVVGADLAVVGAGVAAVQTAVATYGRLDGIVINHGTLGAVDRLADSTAQNWKDTFNVNLFSAVEIIQAALPFLRQSQGKVIVTSSGAATSAYTAWGAYGSSKAAINHLVMTLQVEEPTVTSISVRPGTVDTEMQREIREKHNSSMDHEDATKFANLKKDGKLLRPEQPGHVIARLVLDAPRELSGKFVSYAHPVLRLSLQCRWNDDALRDFQGE
jgi:NAD(P)-dependent dehydrogenase (short-subunit alcohol dehydrogenase family)